jgi:hypothetical protein
MDDTAQLLVSSIDEMIVRAAKRLVEQRLLLESLPTATRCAARRELERRRDVIDRLVILRKAMISERVPDSAPTTALGKHAPSRPGGAGGAHRLRPRLNASNLPSRLE